MIKNKNGYTNYNAFCENAGKAVEIRVTVWTEIPQFEISTSRGMGFFVTGDESVKIARELIELLTPIANYNEQGSAKTDH